MSFSESNAQETRFATIEKRILQFWREKKCFEKSLELRQHAPLFSFYDGPPFATGLPHYGHLLAGTIKDVIPRYKTMQGYYVPRRFGWDCHGVPIEYEIEKTLGISGPQAIEALGIKKFNQECRNIVLRYTEEWKERVARMGRWVDFNNPYHTMDLNFMESVWWVFKQLFDKGLVYEGHKVMPFSTALGTPLSNFEASSHYQEVQDPAVTVAFKLIDEDAAILAWTTTPWTLPSNLALMVCPTSTYAEVSLEGVNYIVASPRLPVVFKDLPYTVIREFSGAELVGKRYHPLFSFFADQPNAFQVIEEPTVSMEEGTGIVHSAPAFGEVDFYACSRANIELVCPVDNSGCFTEKVAPYAGLHVKKADNIIIKALQEKGALFKRETIHHRVPFCWRSDTPLIYKAVTTWFVAVEQIKERLLTANAQIHWIPEHIKSGRFGKWLENARDWAISRNRYWGTPIPIWRSKTGRLHVISSIAELEALTGKPVTDLHRDNIDDLTFHLDSEEMRRIPEVFDCWFESGSMPYAQVHYPFENSPLKGFPADFIAEGADQTRGWFYTLTVLAAALFDQPAFQNVIVNGIILAEDGNKMSKRLKNYPEPELVIEKYGADAVRLYLLNSPAVRADDLRFSEKGVEQQLRQVLIPYWNALSFFETYAQIYQWKYAGAISPQHLMDRWILAQMHRMIERFTTAINDYRLQDAIEELPLFIDGLTNWYIRRCRDRFWQDEATIDRHEAFTTLYTVLITLAQVAAPVVPFLTEEIYQRLRREHDPLSVHLCDFPRCDPSLRDTALEEQMALVRQVVSMGHALRKEHQLKVRQPLKALYISCADGSSLAHLALHKALISDELNLKEVHFETNDRFVTLTAKPNFRLLGKKIGAKMALAQKRIQLLTADELSRFHDEKQLALTLEDGTALVLTEEDLLVQRDVAPNIVAVHEQGITTALDTVLTEELLLEGVARELKNKVNQMRRQENLQVTDRIHLTLDTSEYVKKAVHNFEETLKHDLLIHTLTFAPVSNGSTWDLNGHPCHMKIVLVAQ